MGGAVNWRSTVNTGSANTSMPWALTRAAEQDQDYRNMLRYLIGDLESGADLSNDVTAVRAYRSGLLA